MQITQDSLKLVPKKRYVSFSEVNVPIRIDEVFKIVMGKLENRKYLTEFLEAILQRKISSIIDVGTEVTLGKDYKEDKDMKLDLLVQFEDKEIIDVEIQNKNSQDIFTRSLAYSSRLLYNDYKERDEYSKGKKTLIWILDFNLRENIQGYHQIYTYKNQDMSDEKHHIEHHFIQLPKFMEEVHEIRTEEEKWIAYFSGQLNKEEMEGLFKMSRTIEEINKIVEAVMTDKEVRKVLEAREAREMERYFDRKDGYDEGIEVGEEKGVNKAHIQVAKDMLKEGFELNQIIKISKLSKEEIEKLKKELEKEN